MWAKQSKAKQGSIIIVCEYFSRVLSLINNTHGIILYPSASTLFFGVASTITILTIQVPTLLYSTLLYSTLLSTLLYSTLLYIPTWTMPMPQAPGPMPRPEINSRAAAACIGFPTGKTYTPDRTRPDLDDRWSVLELDAGCWMLDAGAGVGAGVGAGELESWRAMMGKPLHSAILSYYITNILHIYELI